MEKPNNPNAVSKTLIAVTFPVPSFLISLSVNKLEIIVQPDITIVKIPAYDKGMFSSSLMIGQADPSSESGRPRLINATYIITISNDIIF